MLMRITNILGALMLVLGLGLVGVGVYMMFFAQADVPTSNVAPAIKPLVKPNQGAGNATKLPQPQ